MIGLEYILLLTNTQHKDLADKLNIKKQNINIWIKGKNNAKIPKKYIPILSDMYNLPQEYFQQELTESDKIKIQRLCCEREDVVTKEKELLDAIGFASKEDFFEVSSLIGQNKLDEFQNILNNNPKFVEVYSKMLTLDIAVLLSKIRNYIDDNKYDKDILTEVKIRLEEIQNLLLPI